MKKIIALLAFGTMAVTAFGQDGSKSNSLAALLDSYYGIKNALVSGDANTAAAKASELVKLNAAIEPGTLSETDRKAFTAAKDKIQTDAKSIAAGGKIEAQRTVFSELSNTFYTLAKGARLTTDPVYQQYCPMKKVYWLSGETAIKNPYYGKAMLTCGKVTDTLK